MDADTEAYVTQQDLPDWSQFATKQDLSELKSELKQDLSDLKLDMREHRSSLIRWMLGSYFGSMLLAGALLALAFKGLMYLFYLDGKLG